MFNEIIVEIVDFKFSYVERTLHKLSDINEIVKQTLVLKEYF